MRTQAAAFAAAIPFLLSWVTVAEAGPAAQQKATLDSMDPQAQVGWEATLPAESQVPYAVLDDRIAVLTDEGKTIRFYALDGRSLGDVRFMTGVAGIDPSPRGDYLLATARPEEDEFVHTLLDRNGRQVWAVGLGSALSFSPSGNFLVTDFDLLNATEGPSAFHAATGRKAWARPGPSYWKLSVAENDILAFYDREFLRLVHLPTGRTLWEQRIDADANHDMGEVLASLDGTKFVVQSTHDVDSHEQTHTRVFDGRGTLLWRSVEPLASERPRRLKAISTDGALLAMEGSADLALVRATDGQELSRLNGGGTCCISVFTTDMLVIDRAISTRILTLNDSGIGSDSTLDEPVKFIYRAPTTVRGAPATEKGLAGAYSALVARWSANELVLRRIDDFRPSRSLRK